jgi:hypothetical protein
MDRKRRTGSGGVVIRDAPYARSDFDATATVAAHFLVAERDGEVVAVVALLAPEEPRALSPARARPNLRGSSSASAPFLEGLWWS